MALFLGGVEFEDVRNVPWGELKHKMVFGALPTMEVDGKLLSQTQAMAAYSGTLGSPRLYPEDPWLAAKVNEAINGCTDVTNSMSVTMRLPDDEKVAARAALIGDGGRVARQLQSIDNLCAQNNENSSSNGWVVGDTLTVADLAIWRLAGWLSGGIMDGVPAGYVTDTFPHIAGLVAAVDAYPKVQEWKKLHPAHYK